MSNGGAVFTAVEAREQELVVTVTVPAEGLPIGAEPQLQWGLFRIPGTKWQHPADVVPPGSSKDSGGGAMRSPLARDAARDVWEAELRIKRRMAPLHLAFDITLPDLGTTLGPRGGGHFVVPVGMGLGVADPLGATLVEVTAGGGPDATCTINFAVFSRHARSMCLCVLRRDGGGYLEVGLDPAAQRTGDVWHIQLQGLRNVGGLVYGWRAGGDKSWADGGAFHPAYIMLDPYCPAALPVVLPQAAYDAAPLLPPQGRLPGPVLLGSLSYLTQPLASAEPDAAPGADGAAGDGSGGGASEVPGSDGGIGSGGTPRRQARPLDDTVLLEVDVARFTLGASAERLVPPEHRGTYLGIIDRLPDIVASGATAVVLSNVFLSSVTAAPPPEGADAADGGTVQWPATEGALRRPLSFMAPEVSLVAGPDPAAARQQLRGVVAALQAAGLEVLLEAEFCLTAEVGGGPGGKLQSVAGLDGDMYMRGGGGPRARGVLNTGQPVTRALVRAALRRWLCDYGVDGFLLVHAENLAQDAHGAVWDSPPLLEELAADPLLRRAKLVASAGEPRLLPRGGERGVPHYGVLAEWNTRYAADVLATLRDNAGGTLSAFATRLMGSPDLVAGRWDAGLPGGLACARRPGFSVNALASPGGPPLLALAGGDNLERGKVVGRSLLLALAVSLGTPAMHGSVAMRAGLRRFAAAVLQLRVKYRHLLAPPLLDSPRDLTWHDAYCSGEPDWSGEASAFGANFIAFSVRGHPPSNALHTQPGTAVGSGSSGGGGGGGGSGGDSGGAPAGVSGLSSSVISRPGTAAAPAPAVGAGVSVADGAHAQEQAVYVGFNPGPEPVNATLPEPPAGLQWRRLIDTSRLPPDDIVPDGGELLDREYILAPGAALMLDAAPRPPLQALPPSARASAVYQRLGQA